MISTYCKLFDFPNEATAHFTAVWDGLAARYDLSERFSAIRVAFLQAGNKTYLEQLQAFSEESGTDRRTLDMLFLLWCAPFLREDYREKGISDTVFAETLSDLRYKLMECYANYGVWGNFVTFWYPGFYRCERFALGRLQYEKRQLQYPAYSMLKEGDTVLNCHIPSCGPLHAEAVIHSLRQAYDFYKDVRRDGVLPVVCHSWLLYPPQYPLLGGNSKAFQDLFCVLKQDETAENNDYWRIFNTPFSKEALASAAEDTSLRRNFKRFLLAGNRMGNGYGILLLDGERVLPQL